MFFAFVLIISLFRIQNCFVISKVWKTLRQKIWLYTCNSVHAWYSRVQFSMMYRWCMAYNVTSVLCVYSCYSCAAPTFELFNQHDIFFYLDYYIVCVKRWCPITINTVFVNNVILFPLLGRLLTKHAVVTIPFVFYCHVL